MLSLESYFWILISGSQDEGRKLQSARIHSWFLCGAIGDVVEVLFGDVGRALDREDDVLRAGKSPWAAFLRSIEADLETLGEDGIGPKSSVAALSSCSVGGTAQLREFQSKKEGLLQLKEFHRKRSCSVETVGLLLAQPGGWHPLRFSFQQVDLVEKLLVGTVRVAVYDDHVEVVPVVVLHLSSSLDDVLQLVVVHLL